MTAHELFKEAMAEDEREGSHFDRTGFFNFFPEELKTNPQAVEDAWRLYEQEIYGSFGE